MLTNTLSYISIILVKPPEALLLPSTCLYYKHICLFVYFLIFLIFINFFIFIIYTLFLEQKHRSSSKFSVHNWVEGLSTKQKSSIPGTQPSLGVKLGCSNYNVQSSKDGRDNLVFDPGKVMWMPFILPV